MAIQNNTENYVADHIPPCEGVYLYRNDDGIQTYDVRMVKPNGGKYIQYGALHTIGHLFSAYAKNSEYKNSIVYIGPMGCRTGFYLLVKNLSQEDVIKLVKESMAYIADFTGKIPDRTPEKCGNYIEHDLRRAKRYSLAMKETIANWTVDKLKY